MNDQEQLTVIRAKHIALMQKTCDVLGNVLQNVTQEQATTRRDGPDGWTVVEVLCHLLDYDEIFRVRAEMMRDEDTPKLPGYDHAALAIERQYNTRSMVHVYRELLRSRMRFVAFFESLSEDDWARGGHHPERGYITMTDALIQVNTHDIDHIEQITRIIT